MAKEKCFVCRKTLKLGDSYTLKREGFAHDTCLDPNFKMSKTDIRRHWKNPGQRLTGTKMKGSVDRVAARELFLFIQNDQQLYRQEQAIDANLRRKLKRGVFRKDLAVKLFMYLADAGAQKYVRGYYRLDPQRSGHMVGIDSVFNKKTRFFVAAQLFRWWLDARRAEGMLINPISRKTAHRVARYAIIAGQKKGWISNPRSTPWNEYHFFSVGRVMFYVMQNRRSGAFKAAYEDTSKSSMGARGPIVLGIWKGRDAKRKAFAAVRSIAKQIPPEYRRLRPE